MDIPIAQWVSDCSATYPDARLTYQIIKIKHELHMQPMCSYCESLLKLGRSHRDKV